MFQLNVNFLSTADDTDGLKSLPESLETLLEEFDKAKEAFKTGYRLPFNDTDFEYDALNKISWIKGSDYKIRLSAASSGYQSVLPSFFNYQIPIRPSAGQCQ